MMKRIIIISVAALVSVSLSLGAVFLLPKFLGSVSEIGVKKNDTVSGGRVSRADSTDAEGAAEERRRCAVGFTGTAVSGHEE